MKNFLILLLPFALFAKDVVLVVVSSTPIYEQNYEIVSRCAQDNSSNVLGTIGGAAIGGAIGSTIGGGHGRNVAIILGSISGAYAGNQIQRASRGSSCVQEKRPSGNGALQGYKNVAYYNGKEYFSITNEPQRKILVNID